ncbi:NADH-quinone oxidoreductase subunit H, partial [Kibdelosporangium lantanae]
GLHDLAAFLIVVAVVFVAVTLVDRSLRRLTSRSTEEEETMAVTTLDAHTALVVIDLQKGVTLLPGTPYPLLGGLRAAAQMISYEIAMGLSIVGVVLQAHSLSLGDIVDGQQSLWYAIPLIPSFLIYAVSGVGESNRAPFDLPEGESELVAGFHTEYSSMKFVIFYIAEYINMTIISAMGTTLFLGGYKAPWPISLIDNNYFNTGWWPMLWFVGKVLLCIFVFIWLRGTLPRFRYDQFMKLGWKFLVPVNLLWILVLTVISAAGDIGTWGWVVIGVGGLLVLIALAFMVPDRRF